HRFGPYLPKRAGRNEWPQRGHGQVRHRMMSATRTAKAIDQNTCPIVVSRLGSSRKHETPTMAMTQPRPAKRRMRYLRHAGSYGPCVSIAVYEGGGRRRACGGAA